MDFITIVFGRGLPDHSLMGDLDWLTFQKVAERTLQDLAKRDSSWLEHYEGSTVWLNRSEPCAVITLMDANLDALPELRTALRGIAKLYQQDAISLRYGQADVVPDL